jgi:two-component system KDP operon response regulator KdpE
MLDQEGVRVQASRLLVVGREPALSESHTGMLRHHRYVVHVARSCAKLRNTCQRFAPHVLLVGADDLETPLIVLLQEVRSWSSVPVLVLSHRGSESDEVAALESGADDYMVTPVGARELLARIRVALRHAAGWRVETPHVVRAGDLEIRSGSERRVLRGGRYVRLSPTEYDLLTLLAAHPDKLLTYPMLIEALWGSGTPKSGGHMLHVYVGRLRSKLEQDPAHPRHLLTEAGAGYRLSTMPVPVG